MEKHKLNSQEQINLVNSHTEWGLLEEVIVGNPNKAFATFWDPADKLVYSQIELAEIERYIKLGQPYPQPYVDAAIESINRLSMLLKSEGVIVKIIDEIEHCRFFSTPNWKTKGGFCAANPRDPFLIIGNQIIETPMSSRSRYFEAHAYHNLMFRKNKVLIYF